MENQTPDMSSTPRILIVEDDPLNRSFLQMQVADMGFDPTVVEDGQRALDVIKNDEPFDLILLDLFMPNMDGERLLECIRADDHSSSIPVIVITAANELERRARILQKGANDFVRKPFDVTELSARIKAHLAARQAVQLASLLEVAGAIAHEINQPLTGLMGYSELIQLHCKGDEKIEKWVTNITLCAERISHTVKRLVSLQKYSTIHYHGRRHILKLDDQANEEDTLGDDPTSTI